MKRNGTLFSWLSGCGPSKKTKPTTEDETLSASTDSKPDHLVDVGDSDAQAGGSSQTQVQVQECQPSYSSVLPSDPLFAEPVTASNIRYENDIGLYIGTKPSDRVLSSILQNHWEPPAGYKYPYSTHNKGGKIEKRFLKQDHLDKYKSWLVFSPSKQGLFCKVCSFFTPTVGGHHKGMKLNTLVTQPLTKFAKLLGEKGDLENHRKANYHLEAVGRSEDFLAAQRNPEKSVDNWVDAYRLKRVQENREKLTASLQNVIFLGRQNIPFRGHRDDGSVFSKDPKLSNKGNFKELMKFRLEECGESKLTSQCTSEGRKGTFLSKTVQNDLIKCCGEEILSQILERVKETQIYSVGFDETTDISHKTQMTIFLRYVYKNVIREDFVGFVNPREPEKNLWKENLNIEKNVDENHDSDETSASNSEVDVPGPLEVESATSNTSHPTEDIDKDPRMTGKKLGENVLSVLKSFNLDLSKCVGIATDGCSVMTSEIVGAVTTIKIECINAERAPCLNHALNLSISKCSDVQSVRNSIGIIREVVSFFTASPKRNAVLTKNVGSQLLSMCETRWVERHMSVSCFLKHMEKIVECLEEISQWSQFSSDNSSVTAKTLLCAITTGEFVITLVCLADVMSQTLPLSRFFQKETIDVIKATDVLNDTLSVLQQKREEADAEFSQLYDQAKTIAEKVGCTIQTPRITSRQVHRANIATSCPESYFRVNIFIPMLESINSDLQNRFSGHVLNIYKLNSLLPKLCSAATTTTDCVIKDVESLAKKYYRVIGGDEDDCISELKAEVKLWVSKWKRAAADKKTTLPNYAVDCLEFCSPEVYPSLRTLFLILCALPVSTATAERSFSTLKLIKTWLRNRCGQSRLTGLALLYVHRDIYIDNKKVIDRYVEKGGKRRKTVLSKKR